MVAYLPLAVAASPVLVVLGVPGQAASRAEQAVGVERQLQSTYTSYTFEGCYVDERNRALDDFFRSDKMTPELCFGYCGQNGYTYMGLQYGNECYCGSLGDEEKHVQYGPGDCNFLCAGDESFNCGGMRAFDLYSLETDSSVALEVDDDGDGWTPSDGSSDEDDFSAVSSTVSRADAPTAAPAAAPLASPVTASTAAPVTAHTPPTDASGDDTDDDTNGDDTTDDDAADSVEDDDADNSYHDNADPVEDDDADVVDDDDADVGEDDDADVVEDDDADAVDDDDADVVAEDDSTEGVDDDSTEGMDGDDADKTVDDDEESVEAKDDSSSGDGECSPNPCLNGGSCKVDPNGGYSCSCSSSYGGMNCETDTTGLPEFFITLEFDGTWDGALDATQKDIFQTAAKRWEKVVTHIPCTETNPEGATGELIISVTQHEIDGSGGQFALGGPSDVYGDCPGVGYMGVMIFDSDDLDDLEDDGILEGLVVHEIGHVIGVGTLWGDCSKCDPDSSSPDVEWKCPLAAEVYNNLAGNAAGDPAKFIDPDCGHWSENVLGTEVMTTGASQGSMELSRITVASLADGGYIVDASKADDYSIPSASFWRA